jgi:hypothetical protein
VGRPDVPLDRACAAVGYLPELAPRAVRIRRQNAAPGYRALTASTTRLPAPTSRLVHRPGGTGSSSSGRAERIEGGSLAGSTVATSITPLKPASGQTLTINDAIAEKYVSAGTGDTGGWWLPVPARSC